MEQRCGTTIDDDHVRGCPGREYVCACGYDEAKDAEIRALRGLVADLADPDPCLVTHHGHCQAHGWMAADSPCPHGRARKLGLVSDGG